MARMNDHIDSIMSSASASAWNVVVDDCATWTVLFEPNLEVTSCSIEDVTEDSEFFYPTLDFYYEQLSNYAHNNIVTNDVYRFRYNWVRGPGDSGQQPIADNPEVGRQQRWVHKLTYVVNEVTYTYSFNVIRQTVENDYTWKSLDYDETIDRYFS